MASYRTNAANAAIIGIYTLLLTVFVISALYFAQNILIPIILAVLLTFLLAPIVTKLERWVGRIFAVTGVVILIFIFTSFLGYILTLEFMDLMSKLPSYKSNIHIKLQTLTSTQGSLSQIWQTLQTIPDNLFLGIKSKETISVTNVPATVNMIPSASITETAQVVFSPLFYVLWTTGLVMLLVIFMLLNREDLRGRIIRLFGEERVGATSTAMIDAGHRVSHYLLMQLLINLAFGLVLAIGLYFLGIPNAELWGGLLAILRFIPYVGTWIAAIIPIVLSFIISTSWFTPLLTIALYLVLDLISSNFLEPLLFGVSTGVSSTALIIAVVFWTLLWGPVGLLLAVPLTVCLVVIGRHVPRLEFLSILLSDEKPLEPHAEYYHRLLADAPNEVLALSDRYLKKEPLISLYDSVFIPILINIEKDVRLDYIEREKAQNLYEMIYEILEDLKEAAPVIEPKKNYKVFCLPVRTKADELAAVMLTQVFASQGIEAKNTLEIEDKNLFEFLEYYKPNVICISYVSPIALPHIRSLCRNIKIKFPQIEIIVGLWGEKQVEELTIEKLRAVGINEIATSLNETVEKLSK